MNEYEPLKWEFKLISGKLHSFTGFEWMPVPVETITDADYYPLPE